MSIKEKLMQDLKAAMKSHDKIKKGHHHYGARCHQTD